MAAENQDKEKLYHELLDVACGTYVPGDLSTEQQQKAIAVLRCRLAQYKTNKNAKEKFGPLMPLEALSQISKVPTEVVLAIIKEFEIELPKNVIFQDEPTFEKEAEAFLKNGKEQKEKSLFDGGQASGAIDYVEKILAMMKSGQIHNISVIAINNESETSLWIPDDLEESLVQRLYLPIVEILSQGPYKKPN